MNPLAREFFPRNTQAASSLQPQLIDPQAVRPLTQASIILKGEEEGKARSFLNIPFNYFIDEDGTRSTRALSSSLNHFLTGFLDHFENLLDQSLLILTGDAASLIRNNDLNNVLAPLPQNVVINFRIKDGSLVGFEPLRAALTLWLDYKEIDLPPSEFHCLRDNFDAQYLQLTLPTRPVNITLQFSALDFIASVQNTPQINLLPLLDHALPHPQSAVAASSSSSSSSSDDILEFIEESYESKTVDQLLTEICDPGSSPVAYALLAIRLFKKSGKLKDPVIIDALSQKLRKLIPDLIRDKQEWLAFELWTIALNKIAFQKLEDLKNPKEAPSTGALLRALLQDAQNEDLNKRFDATLTLYNQLLRLKPTLDRVVLTKLFTLFAPRFRHSFLKLSEEQRKDKIERVIHLLQETFQSVDLPVQTDMSTQFAAACATPELFQVALAQLSQAREKEPGGIVGPGLKLLINQFILNTLSNQESDAYNYWQELFQRFATVKEGEPALFDASLIQRVTPWRYLQSEENILTYPLERFLSFFKTFTRFVSPQPAGAGAAASSSSSSASSACSIEVVADSEVEGALVRGLGHINKAPIAFKQKQPIILELFTENLLSKFPALKALCEEFIKKPSERDLLNGLSKLFPELTNELNTLQADAESYQKLKNILFNHLSKLPNHPSDTKSDPEFLYFDALHQLFTAEEQKQLILRPAEPDKQEKWMQTISQLISLHIFLLGSSPAHLKKAISILKKATQDNLILIDEFRNAFHNLYYRGLLLGQESLLVAICTESNLTAQQLFYSRLIALHDKIYRAFDSKQLEPLDALAEELSQFHKKHNAHFQELKIQAVHFYNKLEEYFSLSKQEPAAKKFWATLNLLMQPSNSSSSSAHAQSSASAAASGAAKAELTPTNALKKFNLHLDKNPIMALECFKEIISRISEDDPGYMEINQLWLVTINSFFAKEPLFSRALDTKSLHPLLLFVCSLFEKSHVRLHRQTMDVCDAQTLKKRNKELDVFSGNLSTFYTQLGTAYHIQDTVEGYKQGIALLHFLLMDFPHSRTIHRYLRPYFYCTASPHQGNTKKIEKSFLVLLNIAEAYSALNNREEALAHLESVWQHPKLIRTQKIAEHLGRECVSLRKWGKALYYMNALKTLTDDPTALESIDKTIGSIELVKQIAGRRALSSFPQYDERNLEAFETFSDFMIHFLNTPNNEWLFYGENLFTLFKKNNPRDLPKSELTILSWILEQTITGLLSDNRPGSATDLYIASKNYFKLDEMLHIDKMVDLPVRILEVFMKGNLNITLRYFLKLLVKLIADDYAQLDQIPFPQLSIPLLGQYHQFFVEEESRLLALVKQNPGEKRSLSLSRLLTFHYQIALICAFKLDSPCPSLVRAFDFFLEISETMPNIGQFDSATLKTAYEANQELAKQLALFTESKNGHHLILALGALRELHTYCPKNLGIQHIVYNRTCEVALQVYETLQKPEFNALSGPIDEVASGFIDLFEEERTCIWIDYKVQNKQQLLLLGKAIHTYLAQRDKTHAILSSRKSYHAMLRLVSLNKKQESLNPSFNLNDLSMDKVIGSFPEGSLAIHSIMQATNSFVEAISHTHQSLQFKESDRKKYIEFLHQSHSLMSLTIDQLQCSCKQLHKLVDSTQGPRKQPLNEFMQKMDSCLERAYLSLNTINTNIADLLSKGNLPKLDIQIPFIDDPKVYYQRSAQFFKQALVENPTSDAALAGLGSCLLSPFTFNPNQNAEALAYLKKGNNRNPTVLISTLNALFNLQQYRELLETFENRDVPASQLFSPHLYLHLAQAALKLQDTNRAFHYYEQMYAHSINMGDMISAQRAIASLRVQSLAPQQHVLSSAAAAAEKKDEK